MPGAAAESVGTVAAALDHAARLLAQSPSLAEAQSREILKVAPGHPGALLLLAAALRRQGAAAAARDLIAPLVAAHPRWAQAQADLGEAHAALGESEAAIAALRRAVEIEPAHGQAWRALGDQLGLAGDAAGADAAYARHIKASVRDPVLVEAATALCENRLAVAERLLRDFLKRHPTDVAAIRMLAETGARLGRLADAELLLERCVELAPSFTTARHNYATILHRNNRSAEAIVQAERLLQADPKNPAYRSLRAAALSRIGENEQAIAAYSDVLADYPRQPKAWMSLGHALKTVGRLDEAVEAYRKAIALQPGLGEVWWSLANLKTVRFDDADVAAMQGQLARGDLADEDRFHLHFALGKAFEDARDWAASFAHYAAGNALRRRELDYDPEATTDQARRARAVFTPAFFAQRAGQGCPAPDPIFVVGLPRAGSTLIEQILSSHSQVEGTQELPEIIALARRLGGKPNPERRTAYPEAVDGLSPDDLRALGEEYLERARIHRKTDRPFFVDKMPNNFAHTGLIAAILPNAKIIDARRHPLGCGFAGFKQHFARGQGFTYDLAEIGRYYADYVALMAHFDAVLPGRVHRVIYEEMVAGPEAQVRALLAHCGLPFEDACLRFYENDRAVRTPSSEQVRRPIYTDAAEHWRNYEPWLEPLKAALGPVLESYPRAPAA